MSKFGEPYKLDNGQWAIDVQPSAVARPLGCLGSILAGIGIYPGFDPKTVDIVQTYTSEQGIVWRNIKSGYRAEVFLEGDLGEYLAAFLHRQKMSKISSALSGDPPKKTIVKTKHSDSLGICPFCHDEISVSESTACISCLARHHDECWTTHGACAACQHDERFVREKA